MSRLSREAFIRQFDTNRVELAQIQNQPDISQGVKSSLQGADLNRDGVLSGRAELDRAFSRLDNYDRDGSRNSIQVERDGQETALGRVVSALAEVSRGTPTDASRSSGDIEVALESVRRGLVTLDRGDRGGTVRALQTALSELGYSASVDGDFGPQTESAVMAFQRSNGLIPDGVAGRNTASALLAALDAQSSPVSSDPIIPSSVSSESSSPVSWRATLERLGQVGTTLREGARGAQVQALQEGLREEGVSLEADGVFGPATRRALQSYQWSRGLSADGIAGPQTYQALVTGAPEIERPEPTPSIGNPIDLFPVAGGQFNVGYDSNWNNFDYRTAYHNSDFSLTATDANHPNGHLGVDVFAPLDAPIVAPVAGEVVKAGYSSIGGYHVTIRRGDIYYYHAHLNNVAPNIRPGMTVEAGEYLGGNGATGVARGTEPHLHFSMYRGAGGYSRNPINPFPALNAAILRGSVMT